MGTAIRKHLGDFAALVAIAALALGVAAYILANQDARPSFPLIEDSPIRYEAEFSDAQAVVPGQGQSVRVAGVQVGKIAGVELEDGLAVVQMDIEPQYADLMREDASALLRPRTGLKDMFVELDPGTQSSPAMEEGGRISVENTAPDVDPDEILSALDTDTRDYLKLLISGVGKGLRNNGDSLRKVFQRFEPLHRDLAKVQGAFADRREALSRLVHNYGLLTQELGRNDEELTRLVTASNDVFEAFASVDDSISQAVSLFPGALRTTENALLKVDRLGEVLGPTLDDLRPAFRQLDVANREVLPLVRRATPILRDEIRPFVRQARPYVDDLRPAARKLSRAAPDLTTSFGELNRFFNMLGFNPAGAEERNKPNPETGASSDPSSGEAELDYEASNRDEGFLYWLAWTAQNTVSLHSSSDAEGVVRRTTPTINCSTAARLFGSEEAASPIGALCQLLTGGIDLPIGFPKFLERKQQQQGGQAASFEQLPELLEEYQQQASGSGASGNGNGSSDSGATSQDAAPPGDEQARTGEAGG